MNGDDSDNDIERSNTGQTFQNETSEFVSPDDRNLTFQVIENGLTKDVHYYIIETPHESSVMMPEISKYSVGILINADKTKKWDVSDDQLIGMYTKYQAIQRPSIYYSIPVTPELTESNDASPSSQSNGANNDLLLYLITGIELLAFAGACVYFGMLIDSEFLFGIAGFIALLGGGMLSIYACEVYFRQDTSQDFLQSSMNGLELPKEDEEVTSEIEMVTPNKK